MKILIMGFTKVKFMPYLNYYFDNISKKNEIHILYWNRDLTDENLDKYPDTVFHEFRYQLSDEDKYSKKTVAFLNYRKFAKEVIKKGKYDLIIVLHSLPGALIYDLLKKKYKGKYILDYRDSTYESFGPFQKVINGLVTNSICTFVSSNGFRRYLPKSQSKKIFTSHNLLIDSLHHRDDRKGAFIPSEKIRISFWGFIRHKELNISLIDRIGKDDRFELHYFGRELNISKELKQYAKDQKYSNIFFHGEYTPEERYGFALKTDMIHNLYRDNNTMLAMGNKYYDGVIFRIPQICMPDSYMGKRVRKLRIGIECDPADTDFTEKLYRYYTSINNSDFEKQCDKDLETIMSEYNNGAILIKKLTGSL